MKKIERNEISQLQVKMVIAPFNEFTHLGYNAFFYFSVFSNFFNIKVKNQCCINFSSPVNLY